MWISRGSHPGPGGLGLGLSLSHGWQWIRRGVTPVNASLRANLGRTQHYITLWWT